MFLAPSIWVLMRVNNANYSGPELHNKQKQVGASERPRAALYLLKNPNGNRFEWFRVFRGHF